MCSYGFVLIPRDAPFSSMSSSACNRRCILIKFQFFSYCVPCVVLAYSWNSGGKCSEQRSTFCYGDIVITFIIEWNICSSLRAAAIVSSELVCSSTYIAKLRWLRRARNSRCPALSNSNRSWDAKKKICYWESGWWDLKAWERFIAEIFIPLQCHDSWTHQWMLTLWSFRYDSDPSIVEMQLPWQ